MEAIDRIRSAGELELAPAGKIRFRIPESRRAELAPAVGVLRENKAEALTLMGASDLAAGEAALAFVNKAGARLVRACRECYPDAPESEFLVLVPRCNDGLEFRRCLNLLRIPYPVMARRDPLSHLPARCQHVREASA